MQELNKASRNYNHLEQLIFDYEKKPIQYLQRDLKNGKFFSLYTPYLRKQRYMNVINYANKRGWL